MNHAARPPEQPNLISLFSRHPVAANLLMAMMLLAGVWGVTQLNTQFFPTFAIEYAQVQVAWSGTSAEDVEDLITLPLEQSLRDLDHVKKMTSTSTTGLSSISLEFLPGTDMGLAVSQVEQQVDQVHNLPAGIERPVVTKATLYENVASLLITGPTDIGQLRNLTNRFEAELLDRGISKVEINGLPKEQLAIEIPAVRLRELDLSLDEIGQRISSWSRNSPVGVIGRDESSHQLRFHERREDVLSFASVPVIAEQPGRLVTLGDIAEISRKPQDGQVSIRYRGKPAIEMVVYRTESSDSLKAANILHEWLEDTRPDLPYGVELIAYDERWELIQGRISLLVKNGLGGLLLVVLILFLFMNVRVAWWITVGIPVSFMASLAALYLIGGSINMVTLFALIMTLGIIVDDAIVVGEDAMAQFGTGEDPVHAPERSARRMLGPVFSSSLSTIAVFLPLMLVGGTTGRILQAIPVVVICVIIASLVECFLILPGHLTHSFRRVLQAKPARWREAFNRGFDRFRDGPFHHAVSVATSFRWSVLAFSLALLVLTVGFLSSGRIGFQFFPTAEADRLFANVSFVAGTPPHKVQAYLQVMEETLYEVEQEISEDFIRLVLSRHGIQAGETSGHGDHFGAVSVELIDPDQRQTRNSAIIQAWENRLPRMPGIENLSIVEPRAGPPGQDIEVRITAQEINRVKSAAIALQDVLHNIPGVSGVGDDSPYGREQMVLELTPTAKVLGLSVASASRQLRAAYDGYDIQELSDGFDDIDVTLRLPDNERNTIGNLATLDIVLPGGRSEPIGNLARVRLQRGFETIRHDSGKLAITVVGSVDPAVNNANEIRADLEREILPELSSQYGVEFSFVGRQAEQQETLGDMQLGMMLAFCLMYLILSWVFGSYGWPLLVLVIIPFGIVGAIWGHAVMGLDMTVLSLFGFFGLSGIVVNDSIILIVFYKQLRAQGVEPHPAIVQATCLRFRAVLLTSLTTIAGLLPLLFETSLQAQFLIPMAISIAFGLAFATFLILFLLPSLMMIYENTRAWLALPESPETTGPPA
ncbi:MAG: efflux RND transporter permease subunit [Gammaproteobacteria bacterium]|nr:efflux RND transporter permease subunit [Gammaproteobacteria bacterium]